MPDISRLVIEVDSKGVLNAQGDVKAFDAMLKKLNGTAEKTEKSTADLSDKMGALQLVIGKLPRGLQSIASGLMGITSPMTAVAGAAIEVGEVVKKFVDESIDAFSKFEMIKTNLEVVTGSAELAARTFNELQRFSTLTPFGVDQLSQVSLMLRQAGTSASDLIPTLKALGDVSMGNSDIFNRMAMNYAQVANVGKASSMDMRQFLMAGIPINKMLDDIGKSGSTSFEDIREAIMAASREGGRFEGAMAKGAQTITGLKSQVEGLAEQSRALLAEYLKLSDVAKFILQLKAETNIKLNNYLATVIEIRNIEDQQASGVNKFADEYRKAELEVGKLTTSLEAASKTTALINIATAMLGSNARVILPVLDIAKASWRKQLETQEKIVEKYKPIIDAQKQQIQQQDEFNRRLEASKSKYAELNNIIQNAYQQSTEYTSKNLDDKISRLEKAIKDGGMVTGESFAYNRSSERGTSEQFHFFNPQELVEAKIGLAELQRQKADLYRRRDSKQELTEWQKIFKSAMNLSENDTKQSWFTRQSTAVNEFAKKLVTANDRAKLLYNTLGIENSTIEQAADAWEQLAANMIMSGEWQSNSSLFQQVAEYAKEARDAANEINLDKYISGLNMELSLLKMSSAEMERQKLISEYKVTNENKIAEAIRAQNVLRNEQQRLNLLSNATGLSENELKNLSNADTRRAFIKNINADIETAKLLSKVGMTDMVSEYENALKRIEGLIKAIYSPDFAKTFNIEIPFTEDILTIDEKEIYTVIQEYYRKVFTQLGVVPDEYVDYMLAMKELSTAYRSNKTIADNRIATEKYGNFANELRQREINAWLTDDQIRLNELVKEYGEERGKSIFNWEKEVQGAEALKNAMKSLGESMLNIAGSNFLSFTSDLGKAFQDARITEEEFTSASKNLLRSLIDTLPQLLLNVGLQLLPTQTALGLGFIAASGLMSFVSGMVNDADDAGRKAEADRLKTLQQQLMDLISQQREQQEYYLTQKRRINTTAINVNDAIITPSGIVHTHPEDYIIATKRPQDLMNGGGTNVIVQINNNTDATITQTESIAPDGSKLIELTIAKVVQREIANGGMDAALNARNQRLGGRKVT